jgi:hypothetical protein
MTEHMIDLGQGILTKRERINTVDLLVVFSSDQLLYILIIHFSYF